MKRVIIGLTLLSCFFVLGNDYELNSKKTVIKVKAQETKILNLNITEQLDRMIIVIQYEYWGEICQRYAVGSGFEGIHNDERERICTEYKRGMIQAKKRLRIIDQSGATSQLQLVAKQRGFELDLYLLNDKGEEQKLKRNLFGNYKFKI